MARLLAFGCSYTYGEGLEDCWSPLNKTFGPLPSKQAWPSILGKDLGREVHNFGICGASNKHIWHTILNIQSASIDISTNNKSYHQQTILASNLELVNLANQIEPTDIVVILWTYFDRTCVINYANNGVMRLLPSDGTRTKKDIRPKRRKLTDMYYKNFHNARDAEIDGINRINYINYYLKSKGIQAYHFGCQQPKYSHAWNDTLITYIETPESSLGFALDGQHPSKEAQQVLASTMLSNIN